MYFQQLDSDVATISKSAKGRVLFFDADGVCLLGLSETAQIQMNFDGGYIYIFQDGGGTAVFNQGGVPNTPMEVNCSFYKFTVVGLTDIDGRPFTALVQPNYDQEVYKAKVRDAYEYLVGNIFVGCCNTGTDSILWYDDEASFPATGLVDTLYVDKATPSLFIWDGSAYVAIAGGSGGGVESVEGYSVDNTDPLNPIVKAVPISGTNVAEPMTGSIVVDPTVANWSISETNGGLLHEVGWEAGVLSFLRTSAGSNVGQAVVRDNSAELSLTDGTNSTSLALLPAQASLSSSNGTDSIALNTTPTTALLNATSASFEGLKYSADFSANFILETLISQRVMKSRIWTKAGTPTTSDDSTQGYIVGSLIWDTTNSILYRCTDNTGGAAVWTYANIDSEIIRAGSTIPAATSRWLVPGLSGFGTSAVVNIAEKAIHTTFRIITSSAQPANGDMTITRIFSTPAGTILQSDVLTIPAGSAIGAYEYTGATFDASAIDCNVRFVFLNNGTSSSANVQGLERTFRRTI